LKTNELAEQLDQIMDVVTFTTAEVTVWNGK